MQKLIDNSRWVLSTGIFIALGLMPVIGVPILAIIALFLIFWFVLSYKSVVILRYHIGFLILLMQYPLWNMLRIYFSPAIIENKFTAASGYEMWLVGLLLSFIVILFFLHNKDALLKNFILWAPISIYFAFIVAGYHYLTEGSCRVLLWNPNVFTAPLLLTTISILYIGVQYKIHAIVKPVSFLLIFFVIIISTTFAGTRGITLAQLISFSFIVIYFIFIKKYYFALGIIGAIVCGITMGFALDYLEGCGFTERVSVLFKGGQNLEALDHSSSLRLEMWGRALNAIISSPVWGNGANSEPLITKNTHMHVHNIYLSWLIWGGIFTLLSGALFLFSNCIMGIGRSMLANLFSVIAMTVLWSVSMIFDSFFIWFDFYYYYIIFSALAYSLLIAKPQNSPLDNAE